MNKTDVVVKVSEKTGLSTEICEKVLITLDEVLDSGLFDKLRFGERQ